MRIQLSESFNFRKLLRFAFPSIIMLVFTSIYGVVDGYFVSNFVGKTSFTAVNFVMPIMMILGSFGFMFGTGGSALIAKTMGAGDKERANRLFSLIIYTSAACGVLLSVIGFILIRPIAAALGAEGQLLEDGVAYGNVILLAIPAFVLQYEFQCLFATAEKPTLGLIITVASGVTNMVLDALFVAVFQWGLQGAAAATALSQCVGGIVPVIYFARPNSSLFRLGKTSFDGRALLRTFTNGSSELMTNISTSVVSMLYNTQLLKYAGEDGVAAYGVLMYVGFVFNAMFIGYSMGTAPIVGYHFGACDHKELKGLLRRGLTIIGGFALAMFGAALALSRPLSLIFVGYDEGLMELTVHAFSIYAFVFLFSGFAIFGSSFFTALNDGLTSAIISFLRTLVFQISAVLIFPIFWKVDGIWFSIVAAEVMAVAVTALFLKIKQKKYHY